MARVLDYLRRLGLPWLGPSLNGSAKAIATISHEKIKTQFGPASGKIWLLPYADSLTGETQTILDAYPMMMKEPAVKAGVLDKVLTVAALDPTAISDGDSDADKRCTRFCQYAIGRVRGGLLGFVEQSIFPGLLRGFSITDRALALETEGPWAGKIVLDSVKAKNPKHLQFQVDEYDNLTGIISNTYDHGTTFDPKGFYVWQHLPLYGSPMGMSDLRSAYRAYWIKDTAWKLRAIYLEKFSAGALIKGTYSDISQKIALEEALDQVRASTWVSVPEGALIEAVNLAVSDQGTFDAAIKACNEDISLGISGAILQNLTSTAERGNTAIHKSTSDIRKWHLQTCVQNLWNEQVFPDLQALNFVGVAKVRLFLGGVNDVELAQSLAVDVGLNRDLRLQLSKKDVYRRYGRPVPESPEDVLEPAAMGPGFPALNGAGGQAVNGQAAAAQQIGGQFDDAPKTDPVAEAVAVEHARLEKKHGPDVASRVLKAATALLQPAPVAAFAESRAVAPPVINVHVPKPDQVVRVSMPPRPMMRTVVERDPVNGLIVGSHQEEIDAFCMVGEPKPGPCPGPGQSDDSPPSSPPNTPAFKSWFASSKVTDATGQPLVVHHGATQSFDQFQGNAFFTDKKDVAKDFAKSRAENAGEVNPVPRIISAYLSIKKPFVIDAKGEAAGNIQFASGDRYGYRKALADGKYDGVIIRNTKDEGNLFVAKSPHQIKSVDNQGTFDPASPKYTHQE